MNGFFTNFFIAFLTFMAFVAFITGIGLGPILFVIWMGLSPFPYGIPIAFLIWGILVGFLYAVHEYVGLDQK